MLISSNKPRDAVSPKNGTGQTDRALGNICSIPDKRDKKEDLSITKWTPYSSKLEVVDFW